MIATFLWPPTSLITFLERFLHSSSFTPSRYLPVVFVDGICACKQLTFGVNN